MLNNQTLPPEALAARSDLWVLPTPRFSRWFSQLDWYLNWQMCKGLAYAGLHLPAETYRVAEEYGFTVRERGPECDGPLLISTEGRVGARRCMVIDGAMPLKSWIALAAEAAQKLGAHDVRVFLPTGADSTEAGKLWKKSSDRDVQILPDLETA